MTPDALSVVAAVAVVALGLAIFIGGWQLDSRRTLVFSAFLVFCVNEILRNWVAAASAPYRGIGSGFVALHYLVLSLASFVAGFVITNRVFASPRSDSDAFLTRGVEQVPQRDLALVIGSSALVLLAGGLYLYQGIPPVLLALVSLARGDDGAVVAFFVSASREELTKGYLFGGEYRGQGVLRSMMGWGWPMLCAMAALTYHGTRRRGWLLASALLLFLAFLFIAGTGSRGPFVWALVYVFMALSLVIRIRAWYLGVAFGGLLLLVLGLSAYSGKLYFVLQGEGGIGEAFERILTRIFLGNGNNTTVIVDLVNSGTWAHRDGQVNLQGLLNALPGVSAGGLPLAYELYTWLNPGGRATTYLSSTYFAEVFLDFGPVGSALAYGMFGVVVGAVQRAVFARRWNTVTFPFAVVILLILGRIPNVGVSGVAAALVMSSSLLLMFLLIRHLVRLTAPAQGGSVVNPHTT